MIKLYSRFDSSIKVKFSFFGYWLQEFSFAIKKALMIKSRSNVLCAFLVFIQFFNAPSEMIWNELLKITIYTLKYQYLPIMLFGAHLLLILYRSLQALIFKLFLWPTCFLQHSEFPQYQSESQSNRPLFIHSNVRPSLPLMQTKKFLF